jgi:predicted dienelactone hydrolase
LIADNTKRGITYRYEVRLSAPLGDVAIAFFEGQAVLDAPFDLSMGPYPLVILSPGYSIGSSSYAWLTEHLASYGFIVISPEHQESLDPENELWRVTITRPQDILTVFDYRDEQVDEGGILEGLINPDLVGVIGHSYGGYSALVAGGAKLDTSALNAHCESAYEANNPSVWLCDVLLPHLADMTELAGLDSVPNGLWLTWSNPRVDAIVPMAGDAYFFGQVGLSEILVPVMAIGGTLDSDTPYSWGTQPTYEHISSPKKVKVALNDAEHMIFTGPCVKTPWYLKIFSDEFCSDQFWDRSYAHMLIKHFTTAFLLVELKLDTNAAEVLAPDAVEFPNVI